MSEAAPPTAPEPAGEATPPPPSTGATPVTVPPVSTEAERRRRARQRRALVATGVGAVAVVVLLVMTGVLPLFSPTHPTNAIAYSRAVQLATAALPPGLLGSATLLVAFGIASETGGTLAASALANFTTANCTLSQLSGYPPSGQMEVPKFSGSFQAGLAPFWGAVFEGSAAGPFVIVSVVAAGASPVAELSGTACVPSGYAVDPLPNGVADSPQAARAAWNPWGAAFVNSTDATTLTMAAYGGVSSGLYPSPPMWLFVYAPCNPIAGGTVSTSAGVVALDLTTLRFLFATPYTLHCPV